MDKPAPPEHEANRRRHRRQAEEFASERFTYLMSLATHEETITRSPKTDPMDMTITATELNTMPGGQPLPQSTIPLVVFAPEPATTSGCSPRTDEPTE